MDTVELRITAGAELGRVIQIADRPLVFGRTVQKADIVIDEDRLVSSRHFQIQIEAGLACLIDLDSTNGTTLNGSRVTSAQLSAGDVVVAGNTSFLVKSVPQTAAGSSVGGSSSHSFNPFDSYHGPKGKPAPTGTVEAGGIRESRPRIEAVKSPCAGELIRLKGKLADGEQAVAIVEKLGELGGVYLIADLSRFDAEPPEGLDIEASKIFYWLPAVAAVRAPLLIALTECESWRSYIEDSWGSDAVVILQSSLEKQVLVESLRELMYGNGNEAHVGQSINGFCWPTVLAAVIEQDSEALGRTLLQHTDVAMIETPGDPESWQLYATDETLEKILELGFNVTEEMSQPTAESAG